jgi:ubiquitin-conjugating enzyme E2 J2
MNQQSTDMSLIKRKNSLQQQQQQQQLQTKPNSPSTDLHQQPQQHPITRTVSRGKRWLVVLVVFVYLILSKLIARSTTSST